ncbi:hypothetical protein ACIBO2_44695 [Nonomuraea sp. NPDC050022]|uniref:hypothetical protein n=1 Tax=unclassified Nonomuraea TaxID=2593643 RepID=UPI0033E7CC92
MEIPNGIRINKEVAMTRRAAYPNFRPRDPIQLTRVRGTLHFWATWSCLVDLYTEGIHRLALTLPIVIIALLDTWHAFRGTPSTSDNSSASDNHRKNS